MRRTGTCLTGKARAAWQGADRPAGFRGGVFGTGLPAAHDKGRDPMACRPQAKAAAGGEIIGAGIVRQQAGDGGKGGMGEPLFKRPQNIDRLARLDLDQAVRIKPEGCKPERVERAFAAGKMCRRHPQQRPWPLAKKARQKTDAEAETSGKVAVAGGQDFVQYAGCEAMAGQGGIEGFGPERKRGAGCWRKPLLGSNAAAQGIKNTARFFGSRSDRYFPSGTLNRLHFNGLFHDAASERNHKDAAGAMELCAIGAAVDLS